MGPRELIDLGMLEPVFGTKSKPFERARDLRALGLFPKGKKGSDEQVPLSCALLFLYVLASDPRREQVKYSVEQFIRLTNEATGELFFDVFPVVFENLHEIDFVETFRLNDNESTLFLHIVWYFSKKWKLSIENFSIKNANTVMLEEDIVWEEIVFKEGSHVKGGFGTNLYRVFIGRIFSKGLKHEFGAGLGVHALDANAFIEGEAVIDETEIRFERLPVSAVIPLPNIGLWYYYAPNTKWAFIARADWFSLTVNEYSGSLYDISPGVKYQIYKNFGVGIDYRYFYLKANVNEDNWDGQFNMGFKGPILTLHANF